MGIEPITFLLLLGGGGGGGGGGLNSHLKCFILNQNESHM